jgi:CheY-like chemotaxis protein
MSRPFSILIIEANVSHALRVQLLLQREGYHASIARDGAEGWQKACEQTPDLILLSVKLPILDGFQVLTRLKFGRSTSDIPVIMLMGTLDDRVIERAITLGAVAYLFKDDCLEEHEGAGALSGVISEYLYCGQALST